MGAIQGVLELPALIGPGVYLIWALVVGLWLALVLWARRRWGRRSTLWIVLSAPLLLVVIWVGSMAAVIWLCLQPPGCFSAGL